MLNLANTSDVYRVVTDAAVNVDVNASWVDLLNGAATPGRTATAITTATTTTVVAAPASSTFRNVKTLTIRNKSTTTPVNVTLQFYDGSTAYEVKGAALGPGSELIFTDNGGFVVANPTAYVPSWWGNAYAAFGDGNPNFAWAMATLGGSLAATPTAITASVARIAYFRLPQKITVNKVRFYGVGAVTTTYGIAIYDAVTLQRLSAYTTFTTAAATYGAVYSSLGLTLNANQNYFIAVSVNTTGATAGILSIGTTFTASTGQEGVLPNSAPGNLQASLGFMTARLAQGAVTTGALPDPFPTVVLQAAWTGGMPLFFLDNNNA